ncbi:hypothetical protein BD289DRAFT_125386 [Coniella lustricola]|uniref:Ig-like domain-containing protein n=1 Tax=Coniella lustricola TaxID=2025994 RepID=A0A2T3AFU4_9PEZI|nr:hypothetical protein BD289DRAFT_125386 [Coniella lustricola]
MLHLWISAIPIVLCSLSPSLSLVALRSMWLRSNPMAQEPSCGPPSGEGVEKLCLLECSMTSMGLVTIVVNWQPEETALLPRQEHLTAATLQMKLFVSLGAGLSGSPNEHLRGRPMCTMEDGEGASRQVPVPDSFLRT